MKPVIGLFVSIDNERTTSVFDAYVRSVELAGGAPMIIPCVEDGETLDALIDICDGFIFTGGVDIDPCHYGEQIIDACGEIHAYRDSLELSAFPKIFNTGKPIMGICRGSQLINVALGGTLYQDIPSQLEGCMQHKQTEPKFSYSHDVTVLKDTPLYSLLGTERIKANTFHHQAIKTLGQGLQVMAKADDGIIEAIYLPGDRYLRAYQWHPERLHAADEYHRAIFRELIEESKDDT